MQTNSPQLTQKKLQPWSERALPWLGGAFALLFLYHFFTVWTYVVNVPFWDDWAIFDDNALTSNFNLPWIWAQHNEHRIATSKLMFWILYHLNGWDIGTQQILNFILYGGLIWSAGALARRIAPQIPLAILLAFSLFLLSPTNHENHFMAFNSQLHLVVLFSFLATMLLFYEKHETKDSKMSSESPISVTDSPQPWPKILLGTLYAVLAIYSFSNGLIYAIAMLGAFAVFKILRARRIQEKIGQRREILQLSVVSVLLTASIALWFVGWRASTSDVPRASPFSSAYWTWFFNVLSSGFGFQTYSVWAGLACLGVVSAPILVPFFKRRGNLPNSYWMLVSLIGGLFLTLASITSGRTNYGLDFSKTPRYTEFVLLLLPAIAAGWWLLLQNVASSKRRLVIGALWIFCFFSFLNDWTYFRYYSDKFVERQAGLECVANYYERGQGQEWRCRSIAPATVNTQLNNAQRLNASFVRPENLRSRMLQDTIRNDRP